MCHVLFSDTEYKNTHHLSWTWRGCWTWFLWGVGTQIGRSDLEKHFCVIKTFFSTTLTIMRGLTGNEVGFLNLTQWKWHCSPVCPRNDWCLCCWQHWSCLPQRWTPHLRGWQPNTAERTVKQKWKDKRLNRAQTETVFLSASSTGLWRRSWRNDGKQQQHFVSPTSNQTSCSHSGKKLQSGFWLLICLKSDML